MSDSREDQFRALYDETRPKIIAYAVRRASSREDAADIVAETYEIAWRRFEDVPTGQSALLWLYVTARYVLANQGRRLRRSGQIVAALSEELKDVSKHMDIDEQTVMMESCLKSLSTDDREVLMLTGWEGLSSSELGRVLGCSPVAARLRLHRARSRLEAAMGAETPLRKRSGSIGHVEDCSQQQSGTSRS
jgi:RNA polymerase sigma factor (sigma-70 family)